MIKSLVQNSSEINQNCSYINKPASKIWNICFVQMLVIIVMYNLFFW